MHDLVAELIGYQNDLASAVRYGRDELAEADRAAIARVRAAIEARAGDLDSEGSAVARAEAARLRDAIASTPLETATPAVLETATPPRKRTATKAA